MDLQKYQLLNTVTQSSHLRESQQLTNSWHILMIVWKGRCLLVMVKTSEVTGQVHKGKLKR